MPIVVSQNERTKVYNFNGVVASIPNGNTIFASTVTELDTLTENYERLEKIIKPDAMPEQAERISGPLLTSSRRALIAATNEAKDTLTADARALEPIKATVDAATRIGSEIRSSFPADPAGQVAFIQRASSVQLAALLEGDPGFASMSESAREIGRDRAIRLFHVERVALGASNPARPSIHRIIAVGVDRDAIDTQATVAIEEHRSRLAQIETNEATMQGLIAFIAAVLSIAPSQALDKLLAA